MTHLIILGLGALGIALYLASIYGIGFLFAWTVNKLSRGKVSTENAFFYGFSGFCGLALAYAFGLMLSLHFNIGV